jgi:hypothetical protein
MLWRGADQEVRIEGDAAVGEMIVREHDQHIGTRLSQLPGDGGVGVGDDLPRFVRRLVEQADNSRRMRRTGCKNDLRHNALLRWKLFYIH